MRSKSREENDRVLVRIRVKERVAKEKSGTRLRRGDRILLIILGGCLGLGIGYIVAEKIIGSLNPPVGVQERSDSDRIVQPVEVGEARDRSIIDLDFDLPSEGE